MNPRILTRRQMMGAAAPTLLGAAQQPPGRRPRIAAVASIYHKYAQHICDRFLIGYGWNGKHHKPEIDLASLWVHQVKQNDVSRSRAKEFPVMKIYPTIADPLTLGTGKLAVDGVLLIGEHGDYPDNEKGQKLYPRYEFFREIVKVFGTSGRGVPVFNDKHLSWNWHWAREMYDTSRRIGFPFMAGSSLRVTWRTPSVDMPYGAPVREALCVFGGWIDGGDICAFETLHCMSERRKGGESGFAARIDGRNEPLSTQMYLPMPPAYTTASRLIPWNEHLLTTGLTASGVESLYQREKLILTPHLEKVSYPAPKESTFWRT
jgi:hypothetical protein